MSKYQNESTGTPRTTGGSFDGLFRGLGNVIKVATDLVDSSEDAVEISRTGVIGSATTAQGMYGLSVRVGPPRRPAFRKPAPLRRQSAASCAEGLREPPADLFDEGDHYLVVVELSGVDESALRCSIRGNSLMIEAAGEAEHYYKELQFASSVNEETVTTAYKNGILELRLWKQ